MYLEQAEICNFRGIRHLKVDFEADTTALIGENSWGKTSLLRALWMLLGQGTQLCRFERKDLYVPVPLLGEDLAEPAPERPAAEPPARSIGFNRISTRHWQNNRRMRQERIEELRKALELDELDRAEYEFTTQDVYREEIRELSIDLWFREAPVGGEQVLEGPLAPYWNYSRDAGCYRLHWRVSAADRNGHFSTLHELLSRRAPSRGPQAEAALLRLIELNPVLRLRDRRMVSGEGREQSAEDQGIGALIDAMINGVAKSADEVRAGVDILNALLQKYLTGYDQRARGSSQPDRPAIGDIVSRPLSVETISSLREMLDSPDLNRTKLLAMLLAGSVHFAGGRAFSAEARPIIILEDIEARFHPSMLLSFWSIIEMMSLQKLVTTNSGDLLSALPLEALRRLQRERYDTRSFKVSSGALPREDLRRIAFHVRLNRPMTLFARCWLLVEGETETWILSQAAALLGMSLPCAGIRPVEFAQCGLAPLIRFARQLGIGFFVVTDGDEAGQKYAATVRGMVGSQQAGEHLCVLPEVDIEHFLYAHGYAQVMRRCAGSAGQPALPGGKKTQAAEAIIKAAIRKKTKPGLALSIIEEMQRRGTQGVPTVLAAMFEKLRLRYVDR